MHTEKHDLILLILLIVYCIKGLKVSRAGNVPILVSSEPFVFGKAVGAMQLCIYHKQGDARLNVKLLH